MSSDDKTDTRYIGAPVWVNASMSAKSNEILKVFCKDCKKEMVLTPATCSAYWHCEGCDRKIPEGLPLKEIYI